ncbi:MAG TPA: hypothetical protein ENH87_03525 [Pricia antarctica]|uniref:Uncharacterized protein n=1 Tax=Pricia antarctica TaxID=641691 RepID=A0A831VTX0_9FLAO|nr:hypothetical protein [Pricia antarctica]
MEINPDDPRFIHDPTTNKSILEQMGNSYNKRMQTLQKAESRKRRLENNNVVGMWVNIVIGILNLALLAYQTVKIL